MMRSDSKDMMSPSMSRTRKTVRNHPNKMGGYERPKVAGSGKMGGMNMSRKKGTKGGY